MKKTKKVLMIVGLLFLCSYLFAEVINVPEDQSTIQQGINAAANGDTVLVQPGTYIEIINYNGKSIVVGSLFLTTGNPAYIAETIIDGNSMASVITIENVTGTNTVLCGFTIAGGYNQEASYGGGGVFCYNSDVILKNLLVSNNRAVTWGGGILIDEFSNATIEDVIIKNNLGYIGGGIVIMESEAFLTNIKVLNNSAFVSGGIEAIYCSLVIENSQISGNSVSYTNGGGISISNPDSVIMNNVLISDNYAIGWGAGLCIVADEETVKVSNSVITGNSCSNDGGFGAGIFVHSCNPIFTNVTITENFCGVGGGGCWVLHESNPTFTNCIFWNNLPNEIELDPAYGPNEITILYSDVQGGEAGVVIQNEGTVHWLEGNIDEDPLFAFAGEHLYSILEDSPCIDAGTPDITELNLPEFDFAGNQRVLDGRIEMGAYEFTTLISTDFTVSYTEGAVPFTVEFTDLTSGYPTEWEWDFNNDGEIDSYAQNPVWTFEEQGVYTVSLTSSNSYNADYIVKEDYINVAESSSDDENIILATSQLIGNYPNPFNPETTISFETTNLLELARIEIFNIKGQKVKKFEIRNEKLGINKVVWDGKNDKGKPVSSGVYFYQLKVGAKFIQSRKMILMK
ncbi:MAG: right-handed parallel beta-helix repeat-containing protein [Candidatus Cloacimonetes bacterium]|nr:right-handed parallel beta-helix repeat-containing protein [Candidatus Cloacimonadota bacterium]